MTQSVSVQLKLRRAFRYGYFAFLAVVAGLVALLAYWAVNGNLPVVDAHMLPDDSVLLMAALILGFSVPLFFAGWLLIGSAILGQRARRASTMAGIRD